MSAISICLWFNDQAEEAVNFYVETLTAAGFSSKVLQTARYNGPAAKASGRPEGSVMTMTFEIDGAEFMALNGGPMFKFTTATSVIVKCRTQEEIDLLWEKLSGDGGKEVQCGWLEDRFGLSWQIVPAELGELMKDPQRGARVMSALMKMKKLDIATLEQA